MMHMLLRVSKEDFAAAARRLAKERAIWVPPNCMSTADPAVQRIELSIGDATMEFESAELAEIFAGLTGT
jgi:hypothetical protein